MLKDDVAVWRSLSPEARTRAREAYKRLQDFDLAWPDNDGYCKHGGYVGYPYGPDYMCHACESGYTDLELVLSAAKDFESAQRAQFFALLQKFTFDTFADYVDYFSQEQRAYVVPMLLRTLAKETEKL